MRRTPLVPRSTRPTAARLATTRQSPEAQSAKAGSSRSLHRLPWRASARLAHQARAERRAAAQADGGDQPQPIRGAERGRPCAQARSVDRGYRSKARSARGKGAAIRTGTPIACRPTAILRYLQCCRSASTMAERTTICRRRLRAASSTTRTISIESAIP